MGEELRSRLQRGLSAFKCPFFLQVSCDFFFFDPVFLPLQRTYTVIVEAWDWDNGTRAGECKQNPCSGHLWSC